MIVQVLEIIKVNNIKYQTHFLYKDYLISILKLKLYYLLINHILANLELINYLD
jgi:hypothetical protein